MSLFSILKGLIFFINITYCKSGKKTYLNNTYHNVYKIFIKLLLK